LASLICAASHSVETRGSVAVVIGQISFGFVMAGHSRSKNGVASLAYAGHPRLYRGNTVKTWMPGSRLR
jgi:hypothetical protein